MAGNHYHPGPKREEGRDRWYLNPLRAGRMEEVTSIRSYRDGVQAEMEGINTLILPTSTLLAPHIGQKQSEAGRRG